jgi:putative ABC transport system permease protein
VVVRAAFRSLGHTGRLSLASVLCIALGATATAAVATIVDATLVRRLPFPNAERLVRIWFDDHGVNNRVPLSIPDVRDARTLSSFDLLLGTARMRIVARVNGGAERLRGEAVSAGYFQALGIQPEQGRLLSDTDAASGAPRVMVLSHRTWVARFGGDAGLLGQSLRSDTTVYTIVGVAPPSFAGTVEDDVVDFWVPLAQYEPASLLDDRSARPAWTIGRLRPGVSIAAAEAEVSSLGSRLAAAYPKTHAHLRLRLEPMGENWRTAFRRGGWMLIAAAMLLLGVAVVNVSGLIAVRVVDRRHEFAVRAALGARTDQLISQLLVETAVIVAAGSVIGMTAAPWVLEALVRLSPVALPGYVRADINLTVLLGSCAVLATAGLLAAIAPALIASRVNPGDALKARGRGQIGARSMRRWGQWLVGVETALTLVLLVAGALLLRTWQRLEATELGYRSEGVARLAVTISRQDAPDRAAVMALSAQIRDALGSYPGVQRVGLVWPTLPPWDTYRARIRFRGLDPATWDKGWDVGAHVADAGLLPTLGVAIVAGRNLQPSDSAGTRVAVVSRALAHRMGGIETVLNRELELLPDPDPALPSGSFRIVGVADDVAYDGLGEQDTRRYIRYDDLGDSRAWRADVYLSMAEFPSRVLSIGVATSGPASALLEPLRRRIGDLAPASAVHWTGTMRDELALEYAPSRFYATLVAAFSTSALLLTGLGVFALLSHGAARMRSEIGLRLVLGATPATIVGLVLRGSVAPLAMGSIVGLTVGAAVARLIRTMLYRTSTVDVMAYAGAVAALAVIAIVASLAPARRASRLNPMTVLRDE